MPNLVLYRDIANDELVSLSVEVLWSDEEVGKYFEVARNILSLQMECCGYIPRLWQQYRRMDRDAIVLTVIGEPNFQE